MKKIYVGITILILIVGGVIMFYDKDDNGNKATIKYVSMNEIQKIMDKEINYIILDVRTIEEYNEGYIPNAICIPNEAIDKNVYEKLSDKNQLLLIYCRSGNRSKQATKKLSELGYTNLIEFGGIIDWTGDIEKQ